MIKKGRAQKLLERDFAFWKSRFERRSQLPENGRRQKLDKKNLSNFFSKEVWIMSTIKSIIVTTHSRLLPKLLSKIDLEKKRQPGGGILSWRLKKATQFLKKFINAISSGGEITVLLFHPSHWYVWILTFDSWTTVINFVEFLRTLTFSWFWQNEIFYPSI